VTGAPAVTLLGKTPLDPHRGGGVDSAWGSRLSDLAARREFRGLRYRYAGDPAGEKVWSISGKPIFDERRRFCGYRGTGSDVTAEVQAREALKHAKERAEAASRAKSDFLANMSHELRTPLNAIIGFSEVIETQVFGPIENQRYIGYAADVHGAGQHLLALINDILDLSKIEAGKGEIDESAVDIGGVVDWAVNLTRERMQNHGLRCSVAGRAGAPMVHADERRMKQILVNLLSNAIKFTPPGGTVSIAVACDAERGLSVSIADTGIGIAAEDIPRALAPFDQIDSGMNRRVEGTGLGLSLTKSIVELHHGTLVIESAVGVGTTVTVVLPPSRVLAQQPPAPQRRNAAA
jgi:signal transduction histidine kinase